MSDMRGSRGVACNDRCGCPSPCPGGNSCRYVRCWCRCKCKYGAQAVLVWRTLRVQHLQLLQHHHHPIHEGDWEEGLLQVRCSLYLSYMRFCL
ncbi:hypothetical protein Pfo_003017, partial [Paulownia fortunei]